MARFGNFDQYLANDGNPLVSGRLYFFETGTTTPKTTYADINNSIANTNPVILTASGRQPNVFFEGVAKAILTDSADVQIAVQDPVGETGTDFGNEWIATRIYSAVDVVRGSDGIYYRSLVNANQNNNPVSTSGSWALLYSVQWNAGITYVVGALVTYNNLQYQSVQGTNLNQNPSTAGSYWVSLQFAWLSTITYAIHQNVIGTDGVLYTSLQNSNTNQVPASSAAWWAGSSAAAASSASAAATSATAAETAETNAETAETGAVAAKDLAVTAQTNAATSETNAETAETNAEASESNAQIYAAAAQSAAGIPSLSGNASKTLSVNLAENGVEWASINSDPILGFANKSSWANNEQISITLDSPASAIAKAHVSIYEEVPQTGVTNNNWDAAAGSYTLEDTAPATSLSFVDDLSSASYSGNSFSVASQETIPNALAFSTAGTKFFTLGSANDTVYEYTCSVAYDLSSTVAYSGNSFSVGTQETEPQALAFNTDGSKFFVVGYDSDTVYEYTCSAGFDLSSTVAYSGNSFSVASQDGIPTGLAFNTAGTKMFVLGRTNRRVFEYTLSVGFDLSSTVGYSGESFSVVSQDTVPNGLAFNADGTGFYITGANVQGVLEYTVSVGFDLSSAVAYSGSSFSVVGQETAPRAIAFDATFSKFFVIGVTADTVFEYTLPKVLALGTGSFASTDVGKTIEVNSGVLVLTATTGTYSETTTPSSTDTAASGDWSMYAVVYDADADVLEVSNGSSGFDLSVAAYDSVSFSVAGQETEPHGIAFNTDGTKMFIVGLNGDDVNEYALSTGFSISTASYTQAFSVAAQDLNPNSIAFNADGTKMFVLGLSGLDVNEYALSTGFNVSTASFTQLFSVSAQDTNPGGLAFNTDGTKMYVTGKAGDDVNEYALTTGFDLSTASYTQRFSVSAQELNPTGITFNTDGTKMYVAGATGQDVNEYALSTGFDISTASFTQVFSVAGQDTAPKGIVFNTDGTKMFVTGDTNNSVYQYTTGSSYIPTGYQPCISSNIDSTYWTDINSLTATNVVGEGNVFYAVSNDARTTWSVLDNSNGVRSIARESGGTWQYNSNAAYGSETWVAAAVNTEVQALRDSMEGASGVGYDLSVASYDSVSFSVASQETNPYSLTFNTDGTKMFVLGFLGTDVNEYALSTVFDVSTASFTDSFSVSAQEGDPTGLAFSADGTKMFVVGVVGDDVNEYALSTGFDVSTASYTQNFSLSAQDTAPRGIAFNADGTKMFVVGSSGVDVNEYALSTGFDVSTASFTDAFSVSAQDASPKDLTFNTDGTKMFVVGAVGDEVNEYALSTGFDVSTASYTQNFSVSSQEGDLQGLAFSADGTKMYIVGSGNDTVFQYTTAPYINQMTSTTLNAITDANQITLGNDLDFAAILYMDTGSTVPAYSGTAMNYDANILNEVSYGYTIDMPTTSVVRVTAPSTGGPRNARVYVSK